VCHSLDLPGAGLLSTSQRPHALATAAAYADVTVGRVATLLAAYFHPASIVSSAHCNCKGSGKGRPVLDGLGRRVSALRFCFQMSCVTSHRVAWRARKSARPDWPAGSVCRVLRSVDSRPRVHFASTI